MIELKWSNFEIHGQRQGSTDPKSIVDIRLDSSQSVYPWAKAEWTGPWSRTSRMWNKSQDIREREKYYPKSTCERGEFWMSWSDWSERFDILNICYIPDERKGINYRIIGDFNPKLNSPLDLPDMKKYYLRSGS